MKQNIINRRYKILSDFERVYAFLNDTYNKETLNSYLLPEYFEYAQVHPLFDYKMAHRNGLWLSDGEIVGIACYEMWLGAAHLHVLNGYENLLSEQLLWAEKELSIIEDGKRSLSVWITDKESYKQELLKAQGYTLVASDPVKIFDYKNDFSEKDLPNGFRIIDGANVDYIKLNACWWRGFDHEGEPEDDVDSQICNAPRFNPSLMTIAVAPNGEYACALGMWFNQTNKYAYLEPLATQPKYRGMGLATLCLNEAMGKAKALGAEYCFGGSGEFYSAIGFKQVSSRELWKKEWVL